MTFAEIAPDRARALIARFAGIPVLVVGDVMIDRFIVGDVNRISPEAPVPVVRFRSEHVRLGGAANVANNLAALGAKVSLVGVVGRDDAADALRASLGQAGIRVDGLVEDASRPTVEKVRVVTGRNQQVARIDYEEDADVSGDVEARVVAQVGRASVNARAIVASDYLKGTITSAVIEALRRAAPNVPLLVDPKIPHLHVYAGATLITPNHYEAERATNRAVRTDDDAREAARVFRTLARCESVLITRGDQGMWLTAPETETAVAAVKREVSDVTGAGDTVAATLALSVAAGATLLEAAVLASHAAGLVVGKFGAATTSTDELLADF